MSNEMIPRRDTLVPEATREKSVEMISGVERWKKYLNERKVSLASIGADGIIITSQREPGSPSVYFIWLPGEDADVLLRLPDGYKSDSNRNGISDPQGNITDTIEPAYGIRLSHDGRTEGDVSEIIGLIPGSQAYFYTRTHGMIEMQNLIARDVPGGAIEDTTSKT